MHFVCRTSLSLTSTTRNLICLDTRTHGIEGGHLSGSLCAWCDWDVPVSGYSLAPWGTRQTSWRALLPSQRRRFETYPTLLSAAVLAPFYCNTVLADCGCLGPRPSLLSLVSQTVQRQAVIFIRSRCFSVERVSSCNSHGQFADRWYKPYKPLSKVGRCLFVIRSYASVWNKVTAQSRA